MSGFDPGAGGGKTVTLVTVHTQGDDRVCPICAPHNGLSYDIENVPAGALPPFHGNCRCYVTMQETGAVLQQADVDELAPPAAPTWRDDTDMLPDDPKGGDVELVDDYDPPTFPAAGAGPWENNTSLLPPNPKGDPWG